MSKSKTVELELVDVVNLSAELDALLGEKLKIGEKWEIQKVQNSIKSDVESYQEQRKKAIDAASEVVKGEDGAERKMIKDQKKADKLEKEILELNKKKVKVKSNIDFSVLDEIETDKPYKIIFQLR